jgi:phage gpG-like protein
VETFYPSAKELENKLLPKLDVVFRRQEKQLFASQGTSGGPRWEALKPAYAKWKRRKYPGRKILTLTGNMRDSLREKGSDHIAKFDSKTEDMIFGTKVKIAAYHFRGNTRMERRNPVQLTYDNLIEYDDRIRKFLLPRFKRMVNYLQAKARAKKK